MFYIHMFTNRWLANHVDALHEADVETVESLIAELEASVIAAGIHPAVITEEFGSAALLVLNVIEEAWAGDAVCDPPSDDAKLQSEAGELP